MAADLPAPTCFADALRTLRERSGYTQEELAERAGVTPHAVSALERGTRTRPYPHTVRSLAAALGLDDEQRAALLATVPRRTSASGEPAPAARPSSLRAEPLPVPPTPLVGRDDEVGQLVDLVRSPRTRLLTLTGVGGVGKSRLALAVAGRAADAFPDGVAWVPLAALTDPRLVVPAVGRAVGLSGVEGLDTATVVASALAPARALLVVDNVEHLLDAAPALGELLEACPGVTVLATSRAALRLRGEREHPVRPLGLPDRSGGAGAVLASAAGALFAERAQAVTPSFTVDDRNAADVARLCSRLAGIPLALELAAAKVRLLQPDALLARLDTAMAIAGARDLPPRQRTMQATLDWSYDLLAPGQQRLFRLLGVFTGGFTLEAAEAVAGGDVLEPLEQLVEHSLVRVSADGTRYDQLEPVLQYARARLAAGDQDEARQARLRHARCFLALAEGQVPAYRRAEAVQALVVTAREEGNLEAALEAGLALGDGELTGRLCWALWLDWWLRGHLLVGRRYAERALAMPMPASARIGTLLTHAAMTFAQGDLDASGPGWDEALRLSRAEGDLAGQAHGVAGQGLVTLAREDLDVAERCFAEAVRLAEIAQHDDAWLWTLAHVWLGTIRLLRGSPSEALALVDTALAAARARGDRLAIYIGLFTAAQAALALGDAERARTQLEEGILLSDETGDQANLAYFVDALAVVESASGDCSQVAVLLGAAQALRETVGASVYGYYKPDEARRDAAAAAARAVLGPEGFDDAVDEGRALEPAQVVALAVRERAPRLRVAT